jgi:hypothetical protein
LACECVASRSRPASCGAAESRTEESRREEANQTQAVPPWPHQKRRRDLRKMEKIMKLVEALPIAPRTNTPRSISSVVDDMVTIRGLLQAEQAASIADRQKMVEAIEETRGTINRLLDGLVELLRGSMDERVASVETVIGGPS